MRILYLADIRFPLDRANGIQTVETCHALAALGHQVVLRVRRDRSAAADPLAFYGLPRIGTLRLQYSPTLGAAPLQRFAYLATAVLHTMFGRPDAVVTRDLGVASALVRIPGVLRPPVVYESHGFAPSVTRALPALLSGAGAASPSKIARLARRERHVWRRANGYVTITRALARELEGRFGLREIFVIPDGVRLPPSRAFQAPAWHSPPVVGYAGHLYPWKGVDLLLSALTMLPEVRGLIVGGHAREPDLARLRRQAETAGIADRVRFTGFVPPGDVARHLADADILALPNPDTEISRSYSSPLKLFEYMALGKPIVASNLPAFREVLSAEEAVLVEPGSPSAIAAAIAQLLQRPSFAARLAFNAFQSATHYTWDARARQLERVISAVLSPAPRGRPA